MFMTNKNMSRRAVLKGVGVTMALPLLEAMVPARTLFAQGAAAAGRKLRFVAIALNHVEEIEEDNDRNRHTQDPKENASHIYSPRSVSLSPPIAF